MKRAILIATGTVGGLGAVLVVTPPQFSATQSSLVSLPGAAPAAPSAAVSAAQSAPATPAPKGVKPSKVATAAPAPAKTSAAPVTAGVNGTFTGDAVDARYGIVQVKITVANGQITDAQAVQAPSGRNDRWTQRAVPILRQQTLQAQSANITGASGASFTSYGWYTSLASALAKAGL